MAGNSFGTLFRITTAGESHGEGIAVIVDGCPAGLCLSEEDIQSELDRRRPGQSNLTTQRAETDKVHIMSGVFEGKTLGTPIMLLCYNGDFRSADYEELKNVYRPSHADFSYDMKYGFRDYRGGGRSSARETWARVAAGAIAKKILREKFGVQVLSYVESVKGIKGNIDPESVNFDDIEKNQIRCPDEAAAEKMISLINEAHSAGDSVGGVITGVVKNLPAGVGEPVFDKLEAELARAMLSINAAKGFEIGAGFDGCNYFGSELNDSFRNQDGKIVQNTNNSGGILGGISTGATIYFRVAFKPTASIAKEQETVDKNGNPVTIQIKGRHDPCILPRAVPVVDAMTAITVLDSLLRQKVNI